MADHITKRTIDALAGIILAGATDAGSNVFTGRVSPLLEHELPAVLVEGGDEEIIVGTIHAPAELERAATIDLVCCVQSADGYDAAAYSLLKQVEHLVAANVTAGGLAKSVFPSSVSWERNAEGEQPIVKATLRLLADLVVANNAVDAPL